ncbi:alpha/beta fold hydrolase [Vibrio neptunius]|uniref:alpha/beta fold hydrolase n=1 Tax=Vibrio neptunius TaxID=170651 RepID=UPI001C5CBCBC|nr:alpha/beta hydrolase [Vibrio neptunius]QXX08333.1 alpha/beta hydrolase [Vibrio neptunius]
MTNWTIQHRKNLQIDDALIYFDIVGDNTKPPLVMLHGGIGSIEDFDQLVPLLSQHFQLIRIDSRGHGRSTMGSRELTYQRLEQDVIAVLAYLNIHQTAVLGFSDGGVIGYRLMASNSVSISKLVTIGADFQLKAGSTLYNLLSGVTGQRWRDKFPDSSRLFTQLKPDANFDLFVADIVKMWTDTSVSGYPGDTIDYIEGDVLIIRGDDDFLFPHSSALELVSRLKHPSFANLPFAGHEAHKDQPDLVYKVMQQFFIRQ